MKVFLVAAALLMTITGRTYSQTPVGAEGMWVTLGLGLAQPNTDYGLGASYNFAKKQNIYRLGLASEAALTLGNNPSHYRYVLNAGVGRRAFGRYFMLAQFVGPALVYAVNRTSILSGDGEYQDHFERKWTPGLAADAQFFVKPLGFILPEVGIGVDLFANLNFVQSFYGFRLSLLFHNTL